MPKVELHFNSQVKTVNAEKGSMLSTVLIGNKTAAEHPCGCKGLCKKCTVLVNGKPELSCKYHINSDITVSIPEKTQIVSEIGADETGVITKNMCLCFDIGTTTLALAIVSIDGGVITKTVSCSNPQRIYGADVMSRIECCQKGGINVLQSVLINGLNQMSDNLLKPFNIEKIDKMYVSGNTTMLHTFFGTDCSRMGTNPYTPSFLESRTVKAPKIGINTVETVISLPNISAFIGADIVAGLNYVGLPQNGKFNLLVDLGTNAEIVLYSKDNAFCTAAAAGPCFEGSNISCGMSAVAGAIYEFSAFNNYSVIGGIKPTGICATGIIDIIAVLLKNKIIDNTGYMQDEKIEIAEGISFCIDDIRQFQLAKSAVYSAILALTKSAGVSFENIENLWVSGGFSSKMNIDNAITVGMLPRELKDKFKAVNNSSLLGTVKFACEQNDLSEYTKSAQYIDLSSNTVFADLFIENMMF